jgi:hypothetical protein
MHNNCARIADLSKPASKPTLINLPTEPADGSSPYLLGLRKEFHRRIEIQPDPSVQSIAKKKLQALLQNRKTLERKAVASQMVALPESEQVRTESRRSEFFSPMNAFNSEKLRTQSPDTSIKAIREMDLKFQISSRIQNSKSKFQISTLFTNKIFQKPPKSHCSFIAQTKISTSDLKKPPNKWMAEQLPMICVKGDTLDLNSQRTVQQCFGRQQNTSRGLLSSYSKLPMAKSNAQPTLKHSKPNQKTQVAQLTTGVEALCLYDSRRDDKQDLKRSQKHTKGFSFDANERRNLLELPTSKPDSHQQSCSINDDQHSVSSGHRTVSQSSSRRSSDSQPKPILKQSSSDCYQKKSVSIDESKNTIYEIETMRKPNVFEMFQSLEIRTLGSMPSDSCFLNIYSNC